MIRSFVFITDTMRFLSKITVYDAISEKISNMKHFKDDPANGIIEHQSIVFYSDI